MTQNSNSNLGTVDKNADNDKSTARELLSTLLQRRDIYLFFGLILGLHFFGIINLPYMNQINALPYYDVIVTIIVSFLLTVGILRSRIKEIVKDIHSKDWLYIAYTDSSAENFGVWKTDPDTISRLNDKVRIEGSETLSQYREGIDVAGRRYALVQDLRRNEDESDEADWVLQEIQGFDDIADHDQIIADKTTLKDWVDTVLPEAEKGRKLRKNLPMIKQKIRMEEGKDIAIGLSRALSGSSVESVLSDMVDNYENKEQTLEDKLNKQREIDKIKDLTENVEESRDFDNIETSNDGDRR